MAKKKEPPINERLTDAARRAEQSILSEIKSFLDKQLGSEGYISDTAIRAEMAKVNRIIGQFGAFTKEWKDNDLTQYYEHQVELADRDMLQYNIDLEKTLTGTVKDLERLHARTLGSITNEFNDRFKDLVGMVARKTHDSYSLIQQESALYGFKDTDNVKAVIRDMRERFQKEGLYNIGFRDARGRIWHMDAYTDMVGRTITARARNTAREMEFLAHGQNLVRISSHFPTCPLCAPWSGVVVSLTEPTEEYPHTLQEAYDSGWGHPNCVLGGTVVGGPRIEAHYARWYEGKLVTLKTSSGDELSCTPNHPILTSKGWVAAGSLNIGDKVIQYVGGQRGIKGISGIDPDNIQIPTRIENIPNSLFEPGKVAAISVPVASEDFHGDGFNSKVNIIRADGFLVDDTMPALLKQACKKFLIDAFYSGLSLNSFCSPYQLTFGALHATNCIMRRLNHLSALIWRLPGHPVVVALTSRWSRQNASSYIALLNAAWRYTENFGNLSLRESLFVKLFNFINMELFISPVGLVVDWAQRRELNTVSSANLIHGGGRNTESASDLLNRLSGKVKFLDVVDRNVSDFAGHVYNLQTEQGWYVANSIITHNCAHSFTLYLPGFSEPGPTEPASEEEINKKNEEAKKQAEEYRRLRQERHEAEREPLKGLNSGKDDTDGISVIRNKEPFDVKNDKAVEEAFRKFAEETTDSLIEKAVVISPDGYKYDVDGVSSNVGIHLVGDDALKGSKIIHNHPGADADSFSVYDFSAFFEHDLDTMEVVYNGKRHRVEWVGKRLTKTEAREAYEDGLNVIREKALKTRIPVENEQYNIMQYLQKNLKGLIFHEL
jgi:hypothetical protein